MCFLLGSRDSCRRDSCHCRFFSCAPGSVLQSQGCRELVQRRASGLVDGTANCVATSNGSRCCLMSKLLPQPLRADGRGLHAAWGAVRGHSFSRHFPGISSRFHLTCLSGATLMNWGGSGSASIRRGQLLPMTGATLALESDCESKSGLTLGSLGALAVLT